MIKIQEERYSAREIAGIKRRARRIAARIDSINKNRRMISFVAKLAWVSFALVFALFILNVLLFWPKPVRFTESALGVRIYLAVCLLGEGAKWMVKRYPLVLEFLREKDTIFEEIEVEDTFATDKGLGINLGEQLVVIHARRARIISKANNPEAFAAIVQNFKEKKNLRKAFYEGGVHYPIRKYRKLWSKVYRAIIVLCLLFIAKNLFDFSFKQILVILVGAIVLIAIANQKAKDQSK